jgi:hypothetical protein
VNPIQVNSPALSQFVRREVMVWAITLRWSALPQNSS